MIHDVLTTSEKKLNDDGLALLEAAVFEHNMRCLPKLYSDISFATLEELLGVDSNSTNFFLQIENMVYSGFAAQVDQIAKFVTFTKSNSPVTQARRAKRATTRGSPGTATPSTNARRNTRNDESIQLSIIKKNTSIYIILLFYIYFYL